MFRAPDHAAKIAHRQSAKIADVNDWAEFVEDVPWFLQPGDEAITGGPRPWSRSAIAGLPTLSAVLQQATVTPVTVGRRAYELLAWGEVGRRRGWLCALPLDDPPKTVHAIHRRFWGVCGGIVEQFGEPINWWNNQDAVMTAEIAETDLAAIFEDYSWLWDNEDLSIPIRPAEYYAVAVEVNGNLTLSHRATGALLLFAPDHAFDGVTQLPGCPPYSLLTIDAAPDLAAWIEVVAAAWQ